MRLPTVSRAFRQVKDEVGERVFQLRWGLRAAGDCAHLGSAYGGWAIPAARIDPTWICYSAGVGEDASFDIALTNMGCQVVAIDPTPRAVDYIKPVVAMHPNLSFVPYALWTEDDEIDFFPPENPEHVSFSATNRQETANPVRVPARSLRSIMSEFGHTRIDLLKLDIEGAEYPVLDSWGLEGLGVQVLCVEYHNDHGLRRMWGAVRTVMHRGYEIGAVNRTDVTFIRRGLLRE